MKECPRCLFTEDIATIGETQCNYCDIHDQLEKNANPDDLKSILDKIRTKGKNKKYDCLMGISGGLDSSTLLYTAVKHWGLNPLVIHFDNHHNVPQATHNMDELVKRLGVDEIIYRVNHKEYMNINYSFLQAGVPDADIPNDIAMTKLMYQTAHQYKIKYILNGHDFRTEGSTPSSWTYMDAEYIRSIHMIPITNYPLFTFKDQLLSALRGIKQVRPFHYGFDRLKMEKEMKQFIGWQDYGGKHCENVYTEYVGYKLLPEKFGIDKRRVYLSAQIRSGMINKNMAKEFLKESHPFDMDRLEDKEFIHLSSLFNIQPRSNFKRYNFKRYRVLIWLLSKMNVVPYTFYIKYCK